MVVERHCLQLQNLGKHISTNIKSQTFPGEHAPGRPRGQVPPSLANFFAPGVKPTCPPVQNLNETPAVYALNSKLVGVTFQICQLDRAGHMDRKTDGWTILSCIRKIYMYLTKFFYPWCSTINLPVVSWHLLYTALHSLYMTVCLIFCISAS